MSEILETLWGELGVLDSDVHKLTEERQRIDARLNLAAEKAEKVRALIALYERDSLSVDQQNLFHAEGMPQSQRKHPSEAATRLPRVASKTGTKVASVRNATISFLEGRGSAHRRDILEMLIQRGIMGQETNQLASLAAYLSEMKDVFETDGRGVFKLRSPVSTEPPPASMSDTGTVEAAHPGANPGHAFYPQLVKDERQVVHDNIT